MTITCEIYGYIVKQAKLWDRRYQKDKIINALSAVAKCEGDNAIDIVRTVNNVIWEGCEW